MARTARPCSHLPGDHGDPARCPHLTGDPSGLCPTHLAAQRARTDATRPNAHRRGYDTSHRKATTDAKARGQRCQADGCTRTDIHRDHHDGNPANNDPSNIVWLCATHHAAKTLTQDVQRDERGRILPKRHEPRRTGRKTGTIRTAEL